MCPASCLKVTAA